MSRTIYVQAQADHIESLFRATPIAAIEELVWNALDADAREVRIDLGTNALGAVETIRVSDDGTGIDVMKADSTFGSLGGSWKRTARRDAGARFLHGRHGRGRFKAFALGGRVEWRTTFFAGGGEPLSYAIVGEVETPGQFEIDSAPQDGRTRGTDVVVQRVKAACDVLLDAAETVQTLAAKFALFLKSRPDVRIYFNGLPVTPVIVQRRVTDYKLSVPGGGAAKLEVIEWKRKFAGSGRLVFTGPDGFQLHEQPAGARSGGASFTAYLSSARFPALNAENALVMDELNPEVRAYVDAAKTALKAHFAALGAETATGRIAAWMGEGSYPFADGEGGPDRARFDKLAMELSQRVEAFDEMSSSDRKVVFALLRKAMAAQPKGTLKEFLK